MPNQSAEGTMSIPRREYLRDLQDQFVNHPRVVKFASVYGETWPLFDAGKGPSRKDLQECLYPEYETEIAAFLARKFDS